MKNIYSQHRRPGVSAIVSAATCPRCSTLTRWKRNGSSEIVRVCSGCRKPAARERNRGAHIFLLQVLSEVLTNHKRMWLPPIIIVVLAFGALIVLAQGSAVAPFIYPRF